MKTKISLTALMALGVILSSMTHVAPASASTPVPISLDGAPVTFSLNVGEEASASFTGVQGQRIIVQTIATNVTRYPSATRNIDVDVVNVRTGRVLADVGGDYEDVFVGIGEAVTLRESGEYHLRVSPDQIFIGDVTLTLKSPQRSAITVGGTSTFTLGVGEEGVATFEATRNQIVTVQTIASVVSRFPSNTRDLDVTVVNARTGRTVASVGDDYEDVFDGIGEAVKLPVTGPFEIRVEPDQYFAGEVKLSLVSPQTSEISVGGGPQTVSLEVGEEAIMGFTATKGQPVTIRTTATNVTRYPSTSRDLEVYVINARTGRQVASVGDDYSDVFDGIGETERMPATGRYEIRVAPDQYFVGDVTIELLAPEKAPITVGGAPVSFDLGVGAEAIATFTAKQGQRVTVQTAISSDSRYPSSYSNLDVYLVNARTGRQVANVGDDYMDVLDGVSKSVTLREAGEYELRISPDQYFVGVVTVSLS